MIWLAEGCLRHLVGAHQEGSRRLSADRGRHQRDEYDFAVHVLDEEIEQLRSASLNAAVFEEDRRAVIERLRTDNVTAESLNAGLGNPSSIERLH